MAFWIRKQKTDRSENGRESQESAHMIRKKKEERKTPAAKRLDNLRIPYQLPIALKSLGTRNEYALITRDLSSNGAFVVCPDIEKYPFQINSTLLDCVVDLGAQGAVTERIKVRFLAKIARVAEDQAEPGKPIGFGVRIVQISNEQRHLLESFLSVHGTPDAVNSPILPYSRADDEEAISEASSVMSFFKKLKQTFRLFLTRPSALEVETAEKQHKANAWLLIRECTFLVRHHDLGTKSAALTYSSILALGPLLATAFFFFHTAGGLEALINGTLIPIIATYFSSDTATQLQGYLIAFVANFKPALLGAVAIVTFLATVVGLFYAIEKAFNDIFFVHIQRPLWRSVLNYWTLLTITPFVLTFSSSKTADFLTRFPILANIIDGLSFLGLPFSILLQTLGFALLFYILPNRKISIKSILLGGFCAALMFRGLQYLNAFLTKRALVDSTATQLYGTAPIIAMAFFFWIKLVWHFVLIGACVSAARENLQDIIHPLQKKGSPLEPLMHLTAIFTTLCDAFRQSGGGQTVAMVMDARGIDEQEALQWLDWLERKRVVFAAEYNGTKTWFPNHYGMELSQNPKEFSDKILFDDKDQAQPFSAAINALFKSTDH